MLVNPLQRAFGVPIVHIFGEPARCFVPWSLPAAVYERFWSGLRHTPLDL